MMAKHLLDVDGRRLQADGAGHLWGSAILSAFIDNIPFVATMIR
jgi:Na+/H+ antiporter NhaD/arsenite permease-like protein